MRFPTAALTVLLAATSFAQPTGPAYGTPDNPANYRGVNATGVLEAKGLVTSFNEKTNIRWRTPLPHFGNSSPVVVKGKAFVTCDPGWKSDNPILVCVDTADGKILWQQEVDNLDAPAWTDAQRAEGKQMRAQEWAWVRKAGELNEKLANTADEAEIKKLCDEGVAAGLGEAAPVREGPRKGKMGFPIFDNRSAVRGKQLKLMSDKGYFRHAGWFLDGIYEGNCYPSVVSDGTCVWVTSNQSGVACFDLGGTRRWIVDIGRGSGKCTWREPCMMNSASPTLIGDTLLVLDHPGSGKVAGFLVALDAATGKERWRTVLAYSAAYFVGFTPVKLQIGDTTAVYVVSGDVIRVSDGKILGRVEHPNPERTHGNYFGAYGALVGDGDRLYIAHSGYGGGAERAQGGVFAFRLSLEGDTLKVERLWENRAIGYHNGMILHGTRLYLPHALDPATGIPEFTVKDRRGNPIRGGEKASPIIADGKVIVPDAGTLSFYALPDLKPLGSGKLPVAPVEGEKAAQQIARLGHTGWGWGDSSPTADGDCIYYRSHDDLWCIGAPEKGE